MPSLAFTISRLRFNFFGSFRHDFYEDFASALKEGAASKERLEKLIQRSRKRKTGWAPLYEHWLKKMHRMSFANAMQHTVPPYEVMVLTAAEESGRLSEAMSYLARAIRLTGKIRSVYVMSLVSPALAFAVIVGFFVSYALVIAPQNIQILPLEKWPPISAAIYQISSSLVQHWIAFLIGFFTTIILVIWSKANWYGHIRRLVDKIPMLPWSGYRESASSHFLLSLAILLQSNNHGIKESLERMRSYSSPWLRWHISKMIHRITITPDSPALAMDTGMFSLNIMDRLEDYSERSDFYHAMRVIAFDHGDKSVEAAQKKAVFTGIISLLVIATVIFMIILGSFEFKDEMERYVQTMK